MATMLESLERAVEGQDGEVWIPQEQPRERLLAMEALDLWLRLRKLRRGLLYDDPAPMERLSASTERAWARYLRRTEAERATWRPCASCGELLGLGSMGLTARGLICWRCYGRDRAAREGV